MSRRLRVLMSSYACEPGKGSEPEVGWQWALQMARFHDVTVLTRTNNRENIKRGLAALNGRQPVPDFVYHDEASFLLGVKRRLTSHKMYYVLWQRSAREVVAQLHAQRQFDLLHHVTFAGVRYPTAVWGHKVPCIWGPVGGIESVPLPLLPWSHPRSLFMEVKRNLHNLLQSAPMQALPRRAVASTVVLASTPEMQRAFAAHGCQAALMPTIGLEIHDLVFAPRNSDSHDGPLKLLFVGNIITLKGVDLALHALKTSGTNATFTLIGDGSYLASARRLVEKLGLEKQVLFAGRIPRQEVLRLYREYDVFLFPSLHDTGGYAVIEAMFHEMPVICLDCGGPPVAVREGCGVKVPTGGKAKVIAGLAAGIRHYNDHRELVRQHGRAARAVILRDYDWDKKGEHMNDIYQRAVESEPARHQGTYTGTGGTTHIMHRMVSVKGLFFTFLMLFVVGTACFFSLNHLKKTARQIANDTIPGLALAGHANAYLADANRTVLFVLADDSEKRAKIRHEIEALSERTSGYLSQYAESVTSAEDRRLFAVLVAERVKYIGIRNQILDLAAAGKKEEALVQFEQALLPQHRLVKAAGDEIFDYNIKAGETSTSQINTVCTITQIAVAGIGVFVFVLGFSFGMFR